MRTDAARDAIRAALAAKAAQPAFRQAFADLRAACSGVLDARTDLALLIGQHRGFSTPPPDNPVVSAMERVVALLPDDFPAIAVPETAPTPEAPLIVSGLDRLLPGGLAEARVLDLRTGKGDLVASLRFRAKAVYGLEARLGAYYRASGRLEGFDDLAFAHPLNVPPQCPTPGFDFFSDRNTERLQRVREAPVDAVVGDLRGGEKLEAFVRWAIQRLGPTGVIAFVADEDPVDDPALAAFRAELEREFNRIAHVRGVTFLGRGKGHARILFSPTTGTEFDAMPWEELHPRKDHVWRTEILQPEWPGLMPLAGDRALFLGFHEGVRGVPAAPAAPGDRRARPVLRQPFVLESRRPERGVASPEGPFLIVAREPFTVLAAAAPPDRRLFGASTSFVPREIAPGALARLRARYGPSLTPRDAFDYAVAVLHHPAYAERYHEDLRRGVPRLPLLEGLEALADEKTAPPVGEGTAFGTGWTPRDLFEPGTIPDFDDAFASPYARSDLEPGFLLLIGLGAALVRTQIQDRDLKPFPMDVEGDDPAFDRLRLSRDRTQAILNPNRRLGPVPSEAYAYRIGTKSALEWLVAGLRGGDADAAARRVGQVVAASLEMNRLTAILGRVAGV